jgi:hypothetical protein
MFVAHDAGAVSRSGGHLSTRSVRRRLAGLLRAAGITRRMSVHSLRHKFATAMVDDGADLNRVRAVLGHASLASTQRLDESTHECRSERWAACVDGCAWPLADCGLFVCSPTVRKRGLARASSHRSIDIRIVGG